MAPVSLLTLSESPLPWDRGRIQGGRSLNWKRGLTRAYIVAWILFCVLGAYVALDATKSVGNAKREVLSYLREHQDTTLQDMLKWNNYRATHRDSVEWFPKGFTQTPEDQRESTKLDDALDQLRSLDYRHPGLAYAGPVAIDLWHYSWCRSSNSSLDRHRIRQELSALGLRCANTVAPRTLRRQPKPNGRTRGWFSRLSPTCQRWFRPQSDRWCTSLPLR